MAKTLLYYNYYLYYKGKKTNLKISDLLSPIIGIGSKERLKKIDDYGEFTLFNPQVPIFMNDIEKILRTKFNPSDRIIQFGKYRDDKPYTGVKGQDIANEIKQDVLEVTTCGFFSSHNLLVMPYNHFGGKALHLEKYINQFLPNTEQDDGWRFEIDQIQDGRGLKDILSSKEIRSINLKIDVLSTQNIDVNIPLVSSLGQAIKRVVDVQKELKSNVLDLSFGCGRKTSQLMDRKQIIQFLTHANMGASNFISAKVKYKCSKTNEIVETDLKHEGFLKSEFLKGDNSTGLEYISRKLAEHYIAHQHGKKHSNSKTTNNNKSSIKHHYTQEEYVLIENHINKKYVVNII